MIENGSKKKQYIYLYDWIRILGTLLVVFGHSTYMTWSGDMGTISVNIENATPNFIAYRSILGIIQSFAYMFHMPLFFALSGALYAIGSRANDLDLFIKNKFKRLIIPYYLGGILWMFPLKYISGFYTDKMSTIKAFSKFAIAQDAMGHLWFLPALFMCFIIFWLVSNFVEKVGGGYGHILFICFLLTLQFRNNIVINGFGFPRCFSYIIYFAVGYGLEIYRKNSNHHCLMDISVFLATSGLLHSQLKGYGLIEDPFVLALIGISWTFSLCTLITKVKFLNHEIIRRLSYDSFIIYIIHEPINFIMLKYGERLISTEWGGVFFLSMRSWLNFILCILMAEFIHFVIGLYQKSAENQRHLKI